MNRLSSFRAANLALRFLLELTALGAFGYWGALRGTTPVLQVMLALLLPSAMIAVWGLFVAPKARFGGTRMQRLLLGQLVFFVAAAAIGNAFSPALGWSFGGVALVNTVLAYLGGPQPGETSPERRERLPPV